MISAQLRHGLGFDIEFNEDICHIVDTGEKQCLYGFTGVIILLPFTKIYIGDMEEICDLEESEQ